ncbi:MAG: hypothetical protein AAFU77_05750 [Myxococcota bacterium]
MNFADACVLVFAAALIFVSARLLELGRRAASPSRTEILARFGGTSLRLWASLGMLGAVDVALFAAGLRAFAWTEPLLGMGAHGWALGFTLVAAASLVAVVILTVLRVYLRSR